MSNPNIFIKSCQIATKVCNHEQIINTDLKPEIDASFDITVEK